MSQDNNAQSSHAVQLFQDAHQKMVMLKRVDEQMAQLLVRRRSLMDELRQVQSQINTEFQRLFDVPDDLPERLQAILSEPPRNAAKPFAQALAVEPAAV
jgi:hypothetical protein